MLKRLLVAVIVMSVLAVFGAWTYAQTNISSACRNVDGQQNSVVRIGVPEGAVGAGGVYCRVIHDGSNFRLSPATIGNLGVLQRGVLAAVEVFGIGGDGTSVSNFAQEMQICLRGGGTFIFMSANQTPRIPSEIPHATRQLEDGLYTCAFISSGGTAILVNGPTAPLASDVPPTSTGEVVTTTEDGETVVVPAPAPVVGVGGAVPLTGCRVTTTAMVRLRSEPNTNSEIIERLPYQFPLQATARVDGWYQVIWENQQGWVSDNFVNESAGCND